MTKKLDYIIGLIKEEFETATIKWGRFNSLHEAYAIVLEEVNELWEEVKASQKNPSRIKYTTKEAIQVAAMTIRLIYDCCSVV